MALDTYVAYFAACIVIVMAPGPTVTLVVASSIRHGLRAGLLNVLGTLAGVALVFAIVGVGLASAIVAAGHWFAWVRFAGALYLIWIGIQMIRSGGSAGKTIEEPRGGFFLQGLPSSDFQSQDAFFFGAFIPQFIDPAGNHLLQIVIMGLTAMAFGALSDSLYALLAARAGRALSARRFRLLSRIGGGFLFGGGLWLAFSKTQ